MNENNSPLSQLADLVIKHHLDNMLGGKLNEIYSKTTKEYIAIKIKNFDDLESGNIDKVKDDLTYVEFDGRDEFDKHRDLGYSAILKVPSNYRPVSRDELMSKVMHNSCTLELLFFQVVAEAKGRFVAIKLKNSSKDTDTSNFNFVLDSCIDFDDISKITEYKANGYRVIDKERKRLSSRVMNWVV